MVRQPIAALRCDDTPQRHAQAKLIALVQDWLAEPCQSALLAELAALDRGAALLDLPVLAGLFTPKTRAATALVGDLVRRLVQALDAEPLGHVPLRHHADGSAATLQLIRSGGAALTLQALDGAGIGRGQQPLSVSFAPGLIWDAVLAGTTTASHYQATSVADERAMIKQTPLALEPGMVLYRDTGCAAIQYHANPGSLLLLRLQLRPRAGGVTREYRLSDGALLHQAAGCVRDSRLELVAGLLGRMGRCDAAPLLAEIAQEAGAAALRWQALRECLGLDTAIGFRALRAIAQVSGDQLVDPAARLHGQLLASYPQLAALEQSCHA